MNEQKPPQKKKFSADTTQVLITYCAIITSIVAFLFLPDQLPVKLIPSQSIEDFGGKTQIFFLPLLIFLLGIVITFRPKNGQKETAGRPYVFFVRLLTVLLTMVLGVQLLYALGVTFALTVLNAFIGAIMLFIGLRVHAGKVRFTFRVKTKWTIKSKKNKAASDRIYAWAGIFLGCMQLVASLLLIDYIALGTGALFVIVWTLGTTIYSYVFNTGDIELPQPTMDETHFREDARQID